MVGRNDGDRSNEIEAAGAGPDAGSSSSETGVFEIHVRGQLSSRWSEWLEGMEVQLLENGEMILSGPIVDQAALMGVLNKLNRLNLTLLSVNEVKATSQK